MDEARQQTVTKLLRNFSRGQQEAYDDLFRQVYDELHRCAHQQRKKWSGNHTMNTTALVHEAYLKLIDQNVSDHQSRAHFYATASKAMRHILINYARDKKREKRGGEKPKLSLDELKIAPQSDMDVSPDRSEWLLLLERALNKLEKISERQSKVVEYRFFGGMTIEDTATALAVSSKTVKRDWNAARLWLYKEIEKQLE